MSKNLFFFISYSTFQITNFKYLKKNSTVNLEKSLKFGDEIAGHFVQGHIDTIGKVLSVKKIDNVLSWFRSYGKQPKDIEGVSEQVKLYIKGRARKIDRTYEGLEKTSYNLAKKFENQIMS